MKGFSLAAFLCSFYCSLPGFRFSVFVGLILGSQTPGNLVREILLVNLPVGEAFNFNVQKWLRIPPSTIQGEQIKCFNWLWRKSSCATVSLLVNVLGTMDLILYWKMYCWFWIGSLAAFAFFSFPFTSFHFLSFPNYFFWKTLEMKGARMNRKLIGNT